MPILKLVKNPEEMTYEQMISATWCGADEVFEYMVVKTTARDDFDGDFSLDVVADLCRYALLAWNMCEKHWRHSKR